MKREEWPLTEAELEKGKALCRLTIHHVMGCDVCGCCMDIAQAFAQCGALDAVIDAMEHKRGRNTWRRVNPWRTTVSR
jgi:hypothetical protein